MIWRAMMNAFVQTNPDGHSNDDPALVQIQSENTVTRASKDPNVVDNNGQWTGDGVMKANIDEPLSADERGRARNTIPARIRYIYSASVMSSTERKKDMI